MAVILTLLISSTALLSFEGKIFSMKGKTITVVGDGVAHLKTGQKFGVYSGETKTGEIQIQQVSHTQAKAKLISGSAGKDDVVKTVKVEKKVAVKEPESGSLAKHWSENQGRMEWKKAKKKCEKLGMRLPTIDELMSTSCRHTLGW